MDAVRFCFLSVLTAAVAMPADFSISIRDKTPWRHTLIEGGKALAEGQYSRAATAYESAVHAISGTSRADRLELAIAYNGLGAAYNQLGRAPDAEPLLKKALATWTDILGSRDVLIPVALNNLANSYTAMGRHGAALRLQAEALKIDEGARGSFSPVVAGDLNNLAVTYANQHKFSEAERAFRRAIAIARSSEPPHPGLSEITRNLATLMVILNHVDEAEQLHDQVLDMQVKERGRRHVSVGLTLIHLAHCELRLKKFATALRHAAEGVGILRARLGDRHPQTAAAYFVLATAYERTKRLDLAESAIGLALEIDKQTVIDPSERSAHLREYAAVLRGEGKKSEAKAADEMAAEVDQQDPDRAMLHHTVDVKELGVK